MPCAIANIGQPISINQSINDYFDDDVMMRHVV